MNDDFALRVTEILSRLEPGDVTTYGEVAAEAGYPGAARAVGRLLSQSNGEWAWWRVVTSKGRLVPGSEIEHAKLLRAEGVPVDGNRVARMGSR